MKGIRFPVSKQGPLRHVEEQGAPDEVRRDIQNMPDQEFGSVVDVMKAFGEEK